MRPIATMSVVASISTTSIRRGGPADGGDIGFSACGMSRNLVVRERPAPRSRSKAELPVALRLFPPALDARADARVQTLRDLGRMPGARLKCQACGFSMN